ncbi:WXG100 family type VII secretion target [Nonomuraea pusilla]|uniref:ESAT-6-like protein n=1 Tax=Nonomuraea pusilla TaxID=46177 RepID=A0A1H7V8N9_9ACTN|nr:WXG100 family type VII secretion target [Nonomuraea pusilla]SEM05420.1 WXG100 family type VII secretion target [Nonomuraea pusilla]
MTDFFGANPTQIKAASGHVVDTAQYVEGLREAVESTANGLLHTGWLGPAASKFQRAMTVWDQSMRSVRQDLEGIAERMGINAITYSAADQDVQDAVGRVESLINVDIR